MVPFLYSKTIVRSVYRKGLKLQEKMFQQRSHSSSQVHKNTPGCYDKSINWGNSSDSIAKCENFFAFAWNAKCSASASVLFLLLVFLEAISKTLNFKLVFLILKISQYGGLRLWVRNPCKNWYKNCYIHFYKTYNQQNWEACTSRWFGSTSRCWWRH